MKLKKINEEHYVVVDEKEIKEGDWMYNPEREPSLLQCIGKGSIRGWKKITHSTQPLDKSLFFTDRVWGCERLSLGEVKELIGEVDVFTVVEQWSKSKEKFVYQYWNKPSFIEGYNQALEDNKEKKYTEEDIRDVVRLALEDAEKSVIWSKEWYPNKLADKIIQSLHPKTEWEVDIINGKLTIL